MDACRSQSDWRSLWMALPALKTKERSALARPVNDKKEKVRAK
jgi:hypothetical protein